jgi:hypothetical protein
MPVDRSCPETVSPDKPVSPEAAGNPAPQVVDWFALTEGNVVLAPAEVPPTQRPAQEVQLEVPSATAIGGLRP